MDKYESENEKIRRVVALLTNIFSSLDSNSKANDILAVDLNNFVGQLIKGNYASQLEFAHYLNRAMEHTKSDPHAQPGEFDELLKVGQFIIKALKLPHTNVDFLIVLLQTFEEKLLGAQRRHFSHNDLFFKKIIGEIFQKWQVVDQQTIYPSFKAIPQQESSKPGRLSFLKGK